MAKLKNKINERKLLQGILLFIGFIALQKLKVQEAELALEIQGLQSEREEWEAKVGALKNGTSYYEAIGREQLGLVKPDEIIIQTEK